MTPPDIVIRGGRVLVGADDIQPASIHVVDGRIRSVSEWESPVPPGAELHEFNDDYVVMPGLVDTHVHINEPGRSAWEGFISATRAAAAGGVTTLLDMPLNSIPATTTDASLDVKRAAANGKCWVDVGFLGGIVPGNQKDILPLWNAGVFGFKSFLTPSGVDEFENVSYKDLDNVLPQLAALDAVLMVHAEETAELRRVKGDVRSYANYLASRPDVVEVEAVKQLILLSEQHNARIHVVHLSSAESLTWLRNARERGVRVTSETCPHYLTFAADDIPDGRTEFECAPPIRDSSHRSALWEAVADGSIDQVVSDHSPCPPELKQPESGDFDAAWGGIASLQLGLSAVWERACHDTGSISLGRIATAMSTNPARLVGLSHRKGRIAPGLDADLVVWRPAIPVTVDGSRLFHRHALTPYSGRTLHGQVETTFVRGHVAFRHGETSADPHGLLLNARD